MITVLLVLLLGNAPDATPVMKEKKVATARNLSTSTGSTAPSVDNYFRTQVVTEAIEAIERANRNRRDSHLDEKLHNNRTVIQVALSAAICEASRIAQNGVAKESRNAYLKKQ